MDMQMPVMDGVDATRALRLNPLWQDLPVVALTANALPADRQRCLAAGCDDFITKPFEPHQLWDVVGRWLDQSAAAVASETEAPAPAPAPRSRFGADGLPEPITGLDREFGLRMAGGSVPLYLKLLRTFALGEDAAATLLDRLAAQDWREVGRVVHRVRGAAGTIGATALHDDLLKAEVLLRNEAGDPTEVRAFLIDAITRLAALRREIRELFELENPVT
jgi:two-component system sensor histidine kinase/response regulator